nr:MAG TPA: hypothetical protein [Bacteriophage sp.]
MLQNKRGTRCPRDGGLGLSSTVFPPLDNIVGGGF